MGRLTVTAKGLSWHRKGHPWIFRDDLQKIESAAPGSVVALEKSNGEFLAQGFYSDRSKIAFRLITRGKNPVDAPFWRDRLQAARRYREAVVRGTNAYRLVYGESDGIPSLILDHYGGHFVLQTLSQGPETLLPLFTDLLMEIFHPASIVLRNDLAVRELEGLPQEKKLLLGEPPGKLEVYEGGIKYSVDVWAGQKTGTYLDQRENRIKAGDLLRGRVLDGFCYQGLFAFHAARSAAEVTGVDSSPAAIDQARENAVRNGLSNVRFRRDNVFDLLKSEADSDQRYDGIILDPPAFAKSKRDLDGAVRGYKELNTRALRLLNPGGVLVTASCSYNLSEA
ncbi:MAG TPA: class I SAM-dependent rRNA methyltransferase, partial [Candidatus Sulfotelmatobacter sp.]|nr:class I SAM-dependent rRNA methyltransferase [Candidatus Sulfotelmatobacter sp.]